MTKLREIETLASDMTLNKDIEARSDKIHKLPKDKLIVPTKLRNTV